MPRSFADAVSDSSSGSTSFGSREAAKSVVVDGKAVAAKQFVQNIAKLRALGGDHQKQADAILAKYGPGIPPEMLAGAGLAVPKQDSSVLAGFKRVGTGALVGAMDILGRPGQAALQTLQAAGSAAGLDFGEHADFSDAFGALEGHAPDGQLNLRSATGRDPNGGGRLAGFFDTVGSIALDPTTYISAGTKPLAEQGLKAIGEHVGEEAAATVAKQGLKAGLTDAERSILKQGIESSSEAALAKSAPGRVAKFLLPSERAIGALAPEEQYAQRVLRATEASGQGGLRFAGFTLASGDALHAARVGAGVSDEVATAARLPGRVLEHATNAVVGKPLGYLADKSQSARKVAGGLFRPHNDVIVDKTISKEGAAQVSEVLSHGRAFSGQEADAFTHRITALAKEAGVSNTELEERFLPALDIGGDVAKTAEALRSEGREPAAKLLEELDGPLREHTRDLAVAAGAKESSELDKVRTKAFAKAHAEEVDAAMAKLPEHREAARVAREEAEKAHQALGDIRADLSAKVEATAGPETRHEIIRDHEMGKKVAGRFLNEQDKAGWEEVRAIRQTEKAVEQQERLAHAIEEARMNRPGPLTHAESKALGAAEARAHDLEEAAKKLESRAASTEKRANKVMSNGAVKRANRAADKAVAKEARNGFYLMDKDYVKRQTTEEGRSILEAARGKESAQGAKSTGLQRGLKQGGSAKSRELYPELPILEAEKKLRVDYADEIKAAGLDPETFNFYEHDPLKLTAQRGVQAAYAAAQVKVVKGFSEIKDTSGNPLLMIGKDAKEEAKKLGYVSISSKYFDKAYVHPSLQKDVEALGSFLEGDEATKAFTKAIDKWGSLWAGYATVPFIFGTGFSARNGLSNVLSNTLAGVRGSAYVEAGRMQMAIAKAIKESDHTIGKEFDAALAEHLSPRDVLKVQEARRTGAIDAGFFTADMADHTLERLNGGKHPVLDSLKPNGKSVVLDRHNPVLEAGAKFNEVVETNARLAHFSHQFDKLGDANMAARSVKKYLFDYNELTPFEKNSIRRYVRFYTYMRKNTPLMLSEMVKQPGKFTALGHILDGLNSGEGSSDLVPQFAVNQGDIKFGNKLVGIDSPFATAMQSIEPALQALTMVPGAKQLLPKSMRPEGGLGEVAQGALNIPSGGPIEVIKFAAEEAFGKSLFSGAPIKTDAGSTRARFAAAIMPLFAKEKGTQRNILDSDGRDPERARLLTTMLGLHVTINDDKAQKAEQYRQLDLVKAELKKLTDAGVELPTMEELTNAGLIPKAKKTKTTHTKPTTAAQRRKAAITSLNAKGVKTS